MANEDDFLPSVTGNTLLAGVVGLLIGGVLARQPGSGHKTLNAVTKALGIVALRQRVEQLEAALVAAGVPVPPVLHPANAAPDDKGIDPDAKTDAADQAQPE